MTLPRQHFLFHFKGEPAVQLKTIDVPEPSALVRGYSEDRLLHLFRHEIAAASMVPIDRAESDGRRLGSQEERKEGPRGNHRREPELHGS